MALRNLLRRMLRMKDQTPQPSKNQRKDLYPVGPLERQSIISAPVPAVNPRVHRGLRRNAGIRRTAPAGRTDLLGGVGSPGTEAIPDKTRGGGRTMDGRLRRRDRP